MVKSKHGCAQIQGNLFCTQIKGKSEIVAWNVDYFNLSHWENFKWNTSYDTAAKFSLAAKGRVHRLDLTSQIVDSDPSQWSNDKLHYASCTKNFGTIFHLTDIYTNNK